MSDTPDINIEVTIPDPGDPPDVDLTDEDEIEDDEE